MVHGSLFSGLCGFDLAAEWMGWENAFHCEWNEFGRRIAKYYWPNAKSYEDITKTDFSIWRGKINILTGGFPCQPFSSAGKRKGADDNRYLWPQMLRVINEIRPDWVVGENVAGITSMVFDQNETNMESEANIEGETIRLSMEANGILLSITEDLRNIGYSVQCFIVPACAVNAPHRRDRIWIIANRDCVRLDEAEKHEKKHNRGFQKGMEKRHGFTGLHDSKPSSNTKKCYKQWARVFKKLSKRKIGGPGTVSYGKRIIANTNGDKRCKRWMHSTGFEKAKRHISTFNTREIGRAWQDFPTQPPVCSRNDGFPAELDGITFSNWRNESIKGYGNAVVPVEVYEFFRAINTIHYDTI